MGALAGLTGLAVGEIAAVLGAGARSPLSGAVRAVIGATPAPMVDVGVAVVGENDKPLLAIGGLAITAWLSGGAAIMSRKRPRVAVALAVAAPAPAPGTEHTFPAPTAGGRSPPGSRRRPRRWP